MKSIENEIEPGRHVGQPRVFFAESTSTQYRNLLASVNLLETQICRSGSNIGTTVGAVPR